MYTDIDKNNRISIHNLTTEEALLISMALSGEHICIDKKMLDLSAKLYDHVTSTINNDVEKQQIKCFITTMK